MHWVISLGKPSRNTASNTGFLNPEFTYSLGKENKLSSCSDSDAWLAMETVLLSGVDFFTSSTQTVMTGKLYNKIH